MRHIAVDAANEDDVLLTLGLRKVEFGVTVTFEVRQLNL